MGGSQKNSKLTSMKIAIIAAVFIAAASAAPTRNDVVPEQTAVQTSEKMPGLNFHGHHFANSFTPGPAGVWYRTVINIPNQAAYDWLTSIVCPAAAARPELQHCTSYSKPNGDGSYTCTEFQKFSTVLTQSNYVTAIVAQYGAQATAKGITWQCAATHSMHHHWASWTHHFRGETKKVWKA